ncbi:unnamed protein product, partial [marine sediment metagenome]
ANYRISGSECQLRALSHLKSNRRGIGCAIKNLTEI